MKIEKICKNCFNRSKCGNCVKNSNFRTFAQRVKELEGLSPEQVAIRLKSTTEYLVKDGDEWQTITTDQLAEILGNPTDHRPLRWKTKDGEGSIDNGLHPISAEYLSIRAKKVCYDHHVGTLEELSALSSYDVLQMAGGSKSVFDQLERAMRRHGYQWKGGRR